MTGDLSQAWSLKTGAAVNENVQQKDRSVTLLVLQAHKKDSKQTKTKPTADETRRLI